MGLAILIGCGENPNTTELIIDGEQQSQVQTLTTGRTPPPTLSRRGGGSTAGGTTAGARTTNNGDGTVNFANSEVNSSPVWLEMEEFMISGERKSAIRVATSLAPTKGTLFILIRLSRWARAEDIAPIKFDDVVVTIRQHDTTTLWHFPDLWPGITSMISIMPLETLEEQPLPRATAELHTIKVGHEFVEYETTEQHRHLVFAP